MAAPARNAPCPCGSGRKYKRCCADLLEHPERTAKQHDAVGTRIQTWAFQHHREAMRHGLTEIVAGRKDVVLGDVDLALISTWILNDRQLPGGGTGAALRRARGSLRPNSLLLGRLMDGPPTPSLWGPVGFLDRETGSELRELLTPHLDALDPHHKPDGLATAMHSASREITIMLAPALRPGNAIPKAA